MPGWDSKTWGYHGDDGGLFHSDGGRADFGNELFGKGDTVGSYIDTVARTAIFTKNGQVMRKRMIHSFPSFLVWLEHDRSANSMPGHVAYGFKGLVGRLFPMVGLRSTDTEIVVNFGDEVSNRFRFALPLDWKKDILKSKGLTINWIDSNEPSVSMSRERGSL